VTRRGARDAARAVDARMESAGNFAIVAELTVTMARSRASASARVSLPLPLPLPPVPAGCFPRPPRKQHVQLRSTGVLAR